MKKVNTRDRREDVINYLTGAILNKKDKLIDVIWDERYLMKILEDYFEGYEVRLIPKIKVK